jgi:hypothetical protein
LSQGEASAADPMINLVTLIQPHLGPSLVSEFGCTYKFVVANEAGTFDVYHLDLKNGSSFFLFTFISAYFLKEI